MLGKIRKIAFAIMFVGLLGSCAQALEITAPGTTWNDSSTPPPPAVEGVIIHPGATLNVSHSDPNGTITLTTGDSNTIGDVIVNAAKISVDGGDLFSITNANAIPGYRPSLVFQGVNTSQVGGNINAGAFNMNVAGNLLLGEGTKNGSITVFNLNQTAGAISSVSDAVGSIITTDATNMARIGNSNSIYSVNGTFAGGVSFENGATLLGTGTNAITGTNHTINGSGNGVLFDNAIMDLSKGSVWIDNGAPDTVSFMGNSQLILGVTSGAVNKLQAAGNTITGDLSRTLKLDSSYTTHYHNTNPGFSASSMGTTQKIIEGGIAGKSEWTVHSVFGDFGFKYDDAISTGAWLNSYAKTDIDDLEQVVGQLGKTFTDSVISTGMASDVSLVANNMLAGKSAADIATSEAGRFNYAALEAMANGSNTFSWERNNGTFGYGFNDKGLIAAMNGSNLSGVNYVAQDVARDIFTTLHARLDAYRAVLVDLESNTALASPADVLNDRYLNRFWAGGIGSWTNAKERKGYEGYKYNGKGVMLGYDRAWRNAIFGIAGAYIEGDYKDKTAVSHDSKINNYAVNAYMTVNGSTGFYATLSGGWVYSDNDIRERRGGLWTTEDYHTSTWHAEGKFGYDIQPCDNWVVTPSIGANFIYAKGSSHELTAEGVAGSLRSYSSHKNHLVEIPVEVQAEYEMAFSDVTRVSFMANGGYAYNLNDHAIRGMSLTEGLNGVETSKVVGRKLGHGSWKAGVGVKVRHDKWDLGVKYDYYGRDKFNSHRLMGTIGYSF